MAASVTFDVRPNWSIQSLAYDGLKDQWFVAQNDRGGGRNDLVITRCDATGKKVSEARLVGGGHGNNLSLTHDGTQAVLWLWWSYHGPVTFRYLHGTWHPGDEPFTDLPNFESNYTYFACDEANDLVASRVRPDDGHVYFTLRRISDMQAGTDHVLKRTPIWVHQKQNPDQGLAIHGDKDFWVAYAGTPWQTPAHAMRHGWDATGCDDGQRYDTSQFGPKSGHNEAEGITVVTRDGTTSMWAGISTGPLHQRVATAHQFATLTADGGTVNLTTIEYDRPVANYIAGLNATGHITHGPFKKTGVTFHHNGGIFTHQQILNIWKTRAASAHFDVDAHGSVAQYANAYDYAWACANTTGNRTTISIEMCNQTTAPKWLVSDTTWKSAARLAAWLFLHIINDAPTAKNIYFHHDWYATECAGPYMDSIRNQLVAEVQAQYRALKTGKTTTTTPPKKKDDPMPDILTYSQSKPGPLTKGANLVQIDVLKNGHARFTAGPTGPWRGTSELTAYVDGIGAGQTLQVRAVEYAEKDGKWVPVQSYWLQEHVGTPATTCIKQTQIVNVSPGHRLRWEIFPTTDCTLVKARCGNLVWKD